MKFKHEYDQWLNHRLTLETENGLIVVGTWADYQTQALVTYNEEGYCIFTQDIGLFKRDTVYVSARIDAPVQVVQIKQLRSVPLRAQGASPEYINALQFVK